MFGRTTIYKFNICKIDLVLWLCINRSSDCCTIAYKSNIFKQNIIYLLYVYGSSLELYRIVIEDQIFQLNIILKLNINSSAFFWILPFIVRKLAINNFYYIEVLNLNGYSSTNHSTLFIVVCNLVLIK
jgi:hypothetical protein